MFYISTNQLQTLWCKKVEIANSFQSYNTIEKYNIYMTRVVYQLDINVKVRLATFGAKLLFSNKLSSKLYSISMKENFA